MQLQSMKNEEKLINNILFLYILGVAISGWAFVMIFLNGGPRECIFLLTGLAAVIICLHTAGFRGGYGCSFLYK